MLNRLIAEEPMISPHRIAERRRVSIEKVHEIICELELRGEVKPERTPTRRIFLSFNDAVCVDSALGS